MKIVLNCMARNEAHHADSAMAHFTSLFDEINVIEHLSTDTTAAGILSWSSESCPVHLMEFKTEGYFQSELMTWLARRQIASGKADWVFFLDFDEYLPFKSRSEFQQALISHKDHPIISMLWHNLIPLEYGNSHHLGQKYKVGPDASIYGKIAFQPKLLRDKPAVVIEQGNHAITLTPGGEHLASQLSFGVFHIPIDSLTQLKRKVETGIQSYKEHHSEAQTALGRHWVLMNELLKQQENEVSLMNCFAARYGENEFLERISQPRIEELQARIESREYREILLDVAGLGISKPAMATKFSDVTQVELSRSGEIVGGPVPGPTPDEKSFKPSDRIRLETIEDINPLAKAPDIPVTLDEFISESYARIETLTPTAWGQHIPFMFSLISTLRPRRYVELGTHCGASFFAVCQRMADLDLPSLAVAIDLWEGDPQAGFYGEEVYRNFEYLRRTRYSKHGRSIKSYFEDAAPLFDEKSVDLIHIDGLHTYDAVAEDYETWRPKLTDHGVILFHDTNEYQSTFGVWDLFNKVRNEATESFEFKHTHGLGILAFGDPAQNPMIGILQAMKREPEKTETHFGRLGELAVTEALYSFVSTAPQPKQEPPMPVITTNDFAGVSTKSIAKVLMRRVRNKASSVIRNSRTNLAGKS